MNNSQIIEILDVWNFWNKSINTGIIREQYVGELYRQRNIKEVSVVAGVRRSGKSTILLQVIKKIIDAGDASSQNTLYINFEEPAFSPYLNIEFLLQIYDAYLEHFNPEGKIFIVLDEIQNVPQWEKFIRGLYDRNEKIKFYITGSSSKLLSKEYGTSLTGRIYSNEIFPLNFKEFLKFKNKDDLFENITGKGSPVLRKFFKEYMEFGGLPQVVLTKEEKDKTQILKDYYSAIIEKDIVQRYEIRDVKKLKEFCLNLIVNISAKFSGYQAEKKQKISQPTANKFLEYAKEVFLVQTADYFSYSFAKQKNNPHKIYIIDLGLYNALSFRFSDNLGKMFENLVYLEYRRKQEDIFYWENKNEVDFLIRKGVKIDKLINVCWNFNNENKQRETGGLLEAMNKFGQKEAYIITMGYDEEIQIDKKTIKVKNFLKYMEES
ncbi:MAG: ATP-binding protein [bacterium]